MRSVALAMPETAWEFRTFALTLDDHLRLMHELYVPAGTEEPRQETYLVDAGRIDLNVKFRRNRLEVKRLVGSEGMIQRWQRDEPLSLPLPADQRKGLEQATGWRLEARESGSLDEPEIIERIASANPVTPVTLTKHRHNFDRHGQLVEFSEVTVGDRHTETIAIESSDLDQVLAIRLELNLGEAPNMSYPAWLAELVSADPVAPARRL